MKNLFNCFALCKRVIPLTFFLFFLGVTGFTQNKITGIVSGKDNMPLSGATVTNKSSNTTSFTEPDGSFTIEAKNGDVMVASFVGYISGEFKINNNLKLNFSLQESIVNLNTVIITGYTSQKIKDITGSVAVVKPKDLVAVPAGQVEQMLQGRVAGLTVITEGEPGAPATIRLHGVGNFGNTTPLYIIDGIQGDINRINPYDIESLQVLKDAAAYSIYGVRGANGVIVITTKKGRAGKTRINFESYIGLQEPLKRGLDLLSPQENADLLWRALKNSRQVDSSGNPSSPLYGNGPKPILPDYLFAGSHQDALSEGSPYVADELYNLDPNKGPVYQIVKFNKSGTDWFHKLFKPAISYNNSITISGANEKNQYLLSLGYLDQEGTFLNTYLKRFTARINTGFTVLNNIHIGENLQLSYTDNPRGSKYNPGVGGGDINSTLSTDPSFPVYDIKGAYNGWYYPGGGGGPANNPVAVRTLASDNKGQSWQAFGNVFAEISFLKNFTAKTSFGGSLINFYNYNFSPGSYDYPLAGYPNSLSEASGYLSSSTWTNTIGFSKVFSDIHSLNVLVGTEMISNHNRENGGTAFDLPFTSPNYWLLNNGDPRGRSNYSTASISKLQSFISRVEYGFKSKYLITGNLRRDGSSIFGPENRYGWFPSVGVAWRITEENFLRDVKWLTDLKLRASYGRTGYYGNTDPSNQFTLYGGSVADAYYDINGISSGDIQRGFRVVRVGNPKTGWQQDIVSNIGIESVLWNGRLSITADWYKKESRGLLFPVTLPDILGDVIPPNINVGNILNTGIDLTLGTQGKFSNNWNWNALITLTHYKNKIQQLNTVPYFFDFFGWVKNEVGYPISSFYGYKVIGLFQDAADVAKSPVQPDAAPGRFKYLDANGDGKITEDDRVHFGNPNPKFTMGINIGLGFKGFDFSTFLYGSFGNQVLNQFRFYSTDIFAASPNGVHTTTALYDSWSLNHKNATAPIAEMSANFSNVGQYNSYALENGSYLRNKVIMLGYTFPTKNLQKIKLDHLRIYFQVVNLFTITSYTGLDPELSGTGLSPLSDQARKSTFGIDTGNYPNNQRQFLLGLTLGF